MMSNEALRRTPLHDRHLAAGARLVPFAGYEMPVRYTSQVEEHHAVRQAAGLFDVSHMGELTVRGEGAADFVQWATPNDVGKLIDGRAHYSSLLGEDGRFLDDFLVYRRSAEHFLLVVNASNRERDLQHLRELEQQWAARPGAGSFELRDESDDWAMLALQGPLAVDLLEAAAEQLELDADARALPYYGFLEASLLGEGAIVSRTGYTGEDGFELYVAPAVAPTAWDRLLAIGTDRGLRPAGLGARDTLRLEAGMHLSGQDLGPDVTPLEVGLGWTVKLKSGDFVGRRALLEQKERGLERRLIGFELEERGIARHGDLVQPAGGGDGDQVDSAGFRAGQVTSGSWSPTLERALGLALVSGPPGFASPEPGSPLKVIVRSRALAGRVAALPFYRREQQ